MIQLQYSMIFVTSFSIDPFVSWASCTYRMLRRVQWFCNNIKKNKKRKFTVCLSLIFFISVLLWFLKIDIFVEDTWAWTFFGFSSARCYRLPPPLSLNILWILAFTLFNLFSFKCTKSKDHIFFRLL